MLECLRWRPSYSKILALRSPVGKPVSKPRGAARLAEPREGLIRSEMKLTEKPDKRGSVR